ncbi:patatin [Nibribacter ruber]|uniref:Patatin n=1 Tax=Nibribacter ruber TaxID=2698458 RepID=A0A6P1P3X1_9BACT|nr:patatin-like phospholipase family protein [Nibribacter ruber]QHL89110.1 patatin [Nibribacter ruber]
MPFRFCPVFRKIAEKRLSFCFLLTAFALSFQLQAQSTSPTHVYKNLALEGGGIRGIAYGGALAELDKRGLLQPIERIAGTSAGAIQACLLAVGYTPEEITKVTFETPIQKFADGRFLFIGGFTRMANRYGWYRGEKFTQWISSLIEKRTGNPDLTFQELHALAGKNGCRDLYITGTNLSRQRTEVFSHETYPTMRVKDAVRISMSVPMFFQAVFMDSTGRVYPTPQPNQVTDVMVDGGVLMDFPLMVFDHPKYFSATAPAEIPKTRFINPETIGIRLDHEAQIAYDRERKGLAPNSIESFSDYINAFYRIVAENLNRHELTPADWDRTVSVSTAGYGPKIKRLSEKDKQTLLESGRTGMLQFFATCD